MKVVRPPKLYLETSVWSHLFADDAPEKRKLTEQLFREIEKFGHPIFISGLVNEELARTPESELKRKLIEAINKYSPRQILLREEATALAERYLSAGVVPPVAEDDAMHMALATVEELEVVVSWNMRHMVRLKTRQGVNAVNKLAGYRDIEIVTPEEVIEYGKVD